MLAGREQSAPTLRSLVKAGHAVVMITGDAPLTACHVAARTHIVTRAPLILSPVLPGADRWQVSAYAARHTSPPSDLFEEDQ